jgi:proteasome accessory factor C
MSKTARILELVRILRAKGFMSKQQILDRFEVTEPTFKRDLAFLRDEYGAQVKYDPQEKVYRLVSAGTVPLGAIPSGDMAEIPGLWFNEQELHSLLTMYELLKDHGGQGVVAEALAPFKNKIEDLLARIASDKHQRNRVPATLNEKPTVFSGDSLEERSKAVRHRIRILPMAARRTPGEQLTQVADAVIGRKRLRINYHSRTRNDETQRDISPQRLVHYRDNWYVDAYCHLRERIATFSVDAITKAKTLAEAAVDITEEDLNATLTSSYGIFSGKPAGTCTLLFTEERSRWVSDEIWHPDQKGQWIDGPNGKMWQLSFPYSDLRELLMDVLKHGDQVQVLEPKALHNEVQKVCKAILTKGTNH